MRRSLALAGAAAAALLTACSSAPPGPHTATLAAAHSGHSPATLNVLTGTAVLKIAIADFGSDDALVRVTTPAAGPLPHLREEVTSPPHAGTVVDLSAPGASAVTVTLSAAATWQLNLGGGTTRTTADLRGGQVSGIAFTAGSDTISLALPRPHGTVGIQLGGGASKFGISLPRGVPARLTAAGGAGAVSLEGQDYTGVAGGSVFTTPGWSPGAAGFDVDATAGAAQVIVIARLSAPFIRGRLPSPITGISNYAHSSVQSRQLR